MAAFFVDFLLNAHRYFRSMGVRFVEPEGTDKNHVQTQATGPPLDDQPAQGVKY
jgi:hypothetical protein